MQSPNYSVLRFLVRHVLSSILSIIVPAIFIEILLVVAWVIAMIINRQFESPVANIAIPIILIPISIIYTLLFIFPSVAISEYLSYKIPFLKQSLSLPLSMVVLLAIVSLVCLLIRAIFSLPDVWFFEYALNPLWAFLTLFIPLCVYWWATTIAKRLLGKKTV
jgi:hypothetical protein